MSGEQVGKIIVTKNGPYVVSGSVPLSVESIGVDAKGESVEWSRGSRLEAGVTYALCRCGHSANAPYCDGTHVRIGFDGTETATRAPYDEQKEVIDGPGMTLDDARAFCAVARFCDTAGSAWDLVEKTDDPASREILIQQATRCPSGRLVVRDKKTGAAIEPKFDPSISVVQDPAEKCSGPLWIKGGVHIESMGGESYESRNRVTLCRCGQSKNKPFCDGTHVEIVYKDGMADGATAGGLG